MNELQGLLQVGETVLSYGVGETQTAAFVVEKDRFVLVDMGVGRKELGTLVKEFRKGLTGIRKYRDLEAFLPEASHGPSTGRGWRVLSGEVEGRLPFADGISSAARVNFPFGIATDGTNLYVADRGYGAIQKIE